VEFRFHVVGLTAMFLFLCSSPCCHRADDQDLSLRQEMARVEQLTVPPGGAILVSSGPDQGPTGATAHWDVSTESNAVQYMRWVGPRLSDRFRVLRITGSQLVFSRYLDGDSETIKIEVVSEHPRLQVHVTFELYPD
jgi:hypothetical protein